ncbi:MAG: YbhB/YbcL family Raf kinase inhibitor-like protein [Candidatus Thermoplasmatota archaeon]|nr:YbhB/YbcL family Raf kinase inhibitor-like protein [Candidatus Thermoplasmatota archaeon]
MKLSSPAFSDGEKIPRKYGYTEEDVNPPLEINGVPEDARSLALVMDDPDAVEPAGKVWDHWVIWNIEPNTREIRESESPPGVVEGKNDYGNRGYGGPNPPDKEHTYKFKLYALDKILDIPPSSTKDELRKAMKGHVLDKTLLEGRYAP